MPGHISLDSNPENLVLLLSHFPDEAVEVQEIASPKVAQLVSEAVQRSQPPWTLLPIPALLCGWLLLNQASPLRTGVLVPPVE